MGGGDPRGGPGRVGDPRGGPGRVGDTQGGLGLVGGPSEMSRTGRGTLPEVQKRVGDTRGGPGRVGGPSWRSGSGRKTLPKFWDGSGTVSEDGTGWSTLEEVRKGTGDHPIDPGRL